MTSFIHTSVPGPPDLIAIREGYFTQEGLEAEWRRFALGKQGRDAMIAGTSTEGIGQQVRPIGI